jgi:acyl carrier protein
MNLREQIRSHLAKNFLFSTNGFPYEDDASLLEAGVVDSTGVLELILFVEESFKIEVADNEVTPENFDSVNRIAAYVERKASVPEPTS